MTGAAQKAGNISQMAWRTRGRDRQAYSFTYDHLSRLSTSTYYDINNSGTASATNRYNENLTYDIRGNISTLQRQGYLAATCGYGQIDNLSYTYDVANNPNRIVSIADNAPANQKVHGFNPGSGVGYTYDANGNLKSDSYKGISNISYNHLNLPSVITYTSGNSIEFIYDAAGIKLKKATNTGVNKNYVAGIEYSGANLEAIYHPEGRLTPNGTAFYYEYALKDHLGNSRIMFRANGSTAQVLQENHYYPTPSGWNWKAPGQRRWARIISISTMI